MDLRQILAVVCIIQLSHASFTKLKDVVPYIHRRDYLKELEKNNFYSCHAKVAIGFDQSTNFGKVLVLDKMRKMVRALEEELSRLPWRPMDPEVQGADIDLVPFADAAEVVHLNSVQKTNTDVQPLIEDYFNGITMMGDVSSFYQGFVRASREAYTKALRQDENVGVVIMMTNGVYPNEGDLDAAYKSNREKGLTHFMIGYGGRDGIIKSHKIYRYADTGKYRFYWKPRDDDEINEIATKIADEIAGFACIKLK